MTWKELGINPSPPQRPAQKGQGTVGRPISLKTNHFEVKVGNINIVFHHYDVSIKNFKGEEITPPLPKSKNMIIFEKMKECFPRVFENIPLSYDSMKNAYSVQAIPQIKKKPVTYEVALTSETTAKNRTHFKVTLKKVNQAALKELFDCMKYVPGNKKEMPTTVVQMMEVMFRHYRAKKYEQVGSRNFFSVDREFGPANYIGGGKEGVSGFFGSLRPAAWKDGSIFLNLDMANTAFYKEQPVLGFIFENEKSLNSERDLNAPFRPDIQRRLSKCLKGLKVRVTHTPTPRTYRIFALDNLGADKIKFEMEENNVKRLMTVQEYMAERYAIRLKHPRVNCLNVGNQNKNVYLPLEICNIERGQKVKKKLNEMEVATFIKSTAINPQDRLEFIKKVALKNKFNEDKMLKAMTFTISDVPMPTTGRVLPAPSLTMKNQSINPEKGVWNVPYTGLHAGATLTDWAVINYDADKTWRKTVEAFLDSLVHIGTKMKMTIKKPFDIYEHKNRGDPNPLEDFTYYKQKNPKIQMIMCILPGRRYYGAIKIAGDTELNIITQCVIGSNVSKNQPQTVSNILLKINAKMGGVNNIVTASRFESGLLQFAEPFIIMGADVNHPPAGDKTIPSLAAVVGSYDIHATKYAVERRAQYHREEMIHDLQEITVNLLKNYRKATGLKPNRIIMFRDGVSESQFAEVLSKEMSAMRAACNSLSPAYKPGITFICVQKRHHTRLFCDRKDGIGKSGNVPPGTIVDRDITHPTETDFYLCSHQGIQGTSKPTHYHLLWDDNDLPIDELQSLTYKLCHVYSRCTRSVSIPTPVYYAHLAAFRAKVYVSELLGGGSDSGSIISGPGNDAAELAMKKDIERIARVSIDQDLSTKLHYI